MEVLQIKKLLKVRGISYSELSAMSGVALNTLKSIFSGRTPNPRYDTIQAIEKALGITAESPKTELTEAEQRLLAAYNALIPPMQEYVLSMIEGLVLQKQNVRTNIS